MSAGHPQLIQTSDIMVLNLNPFVVNILTSVSRKRLLSNMNNGFYNQCIIFGSCEMQLLNLSRIFDCFSRIFGKVVFNLK